MNTATDPVAVRLTCAEAAVYIGVSEYTLGRWRRELRGPLFFHPKPGRPFYLKSDIDDWIAASRVKTYRV